MSRDALVVGINTYSYECLKDLTAPAQDAEAIAKLLEKYGEFNAKRLPAVKDKQNNTIRVGQKTQVTLTQLEAAIVQLFKPEGRNIPDTALLYFSGHGLRKKQGIQEGFLATSDTNPDVCNWGLRLKWLRELLQESEVRQQIIWLDCCYSGELLNFAEADPGDRGKGRDRCFIAASREFEPAFEEIGTNHSVLTTALLQGLEQKEKQVTNYTIVDAITQNISKFPQCPIFSNSGGVINFICAVPIIENSSSQRTNNKCNEEILEESNESELTEFESPMDANSSNDDFQGISDVIFSISSEILNDNRFWTTGLILAIVVSFVSCVGDGFVTSRHEGMKENLISAHRRGNNELVKQMIIKIFNENSNTTRNIEKIDLAKIDLSGANIGDTNLVNLNFSDAYLIGTNLSNTNLRNANFQNANLRNADLRGANLEDANLDGTNLNGADIDNAILTGYNNLKLEQVIAAKNWEKAKYNEEMKKQLGLR
jgi:uncharacterized protein YjbI with pentapeptide repeats